jgi:hypothetical protein
MPRTVEGQGTSDDGEDQARMDREGTGNDVRGLYGLMTARSEEKRAKESFDVLQPQAPVLPQRGSCGMVMGLSTGSGWF